MVEIGAVRLSLATGPDGQLSIAWTNKDGLTHRFFDGASWQTELITTEFTGHVRLAYDASGQLHAVYDVGGSAPPSRGQARLQTYFRDGGQLVHAVKNGSDWTTTVIEEGWEGGIYPNFFELFVDQDAVPHVAFCKGKEVCYATRVANEWVSKSIAPIGVSQSIALVVTRACAHILLRNLRCLVHLQGSLGSEWTSESVQHVDAGYALSAAVGPEQSLHLAYMRCAKTNDRAMYTSYAKGEWAKPEMIERKANNGFGNQLAIGSDGTPHLVYRIQKSRQNAGSTRGDPAQIRYATRVGTKWAIQEVSPQAGWQCAFVLIGDKPWIAYASTRGDGITLANQHIHTLPDGNKYSPRVERLLQKIETDPVYLTDRGFKTLIGNFPPRRFLEIRVNASTCVIRQGLIGEEGETETFECETPQAALHMAQNRLLDRVHWGIEPD